jgi:arrestin-related trafficking adapter 3/6
MDLELDESSQSKSNTLSIRLTESAVFLATDNHHSRTGGRNAEQRSTLLRGLLILHLVKPTRITSIEVELSATASTSWPEGDTIQSLSIYARQ